MTVAADRVFAALSDPTRRQVVELIAGGEASATDLARRLPVTRQAAFGIGSIVALIVGIVFLATIEPLVGVIVVILSPILAAYSQD